jgi:hypothetical protein
MHNPPDEMTSEGWGTQHYRVYCLIVDNVVVYVGSSLQPSRTLAQLSLSKAQHPLHAWLRGLRAQARASNAKTVEQGKEFNRLVMPYVRVVGRFKSRPNAREIVRELRADYQPAWNSRQLRWGD